MRNALIACSLLWILPACGPPERDPTYYDRMLAGHNFNAAYIRPVFVRPARKQPAGVQAEGLKVLSFEDSLLGCVGKASAIDGVHFGENAYLMKSSCMIESGYTQGTNGAINLFSGYALPVVLSMDEPFYPQGASITSAWNDDLEVSVTGLLDEAPQFEQNLTLTVSEPLAVSFPNLRIDTLRIESLSDNRLDHFVLDDVSLLPANF